MIARKERFDVVVTRYINEQPAHRHVRHKGLRESKADKLFNETIDEEVNRLLRGGKGARIRSLVADPNTYVMHWADHTAGAKATIVIEVVETNAR